MKINEVISEAGFFKGVARAIAPQTVQTYDRQKNALRAPQTAGDPAMAKYDKFADIIAQRASSGTQITDQYVASQLPRSGETGNEQKRLEVTQYVIDRLKRSGINVMQKPQTPMPMGLKRLTPVQPAQPAAIATPAPTQPTAQTSQDATKAALAARQAAGLGAYESLDYATFKQRLQEAKTQ
jgi:hypothetical protein